MPLYVKDDQVAELVLQYQQLIGARSKTDALRIALQRQIAAERRSVPLAERVAAIQAAVQRLGPTSPGYDAKTFIAEMWGDT